MLFGSQPTDALQVPLPLSQEAPLFAVSDEQNPPLQVPAVKHSLVAGAN